MSDPVENEAAEKIIANLATDYRCEVCGTDVFSLYLNNEKNEEASLLFNLFGPFYMLTCENCGNSKFLAKDVVLRHRK